MIASEILDDSPDENRSMSCDRIYASWFPGTIRLALYIQHITSSFDLRSFPETVWHKEARRDLGIGN